MKRHLSRAILLTCALLLVGTLYLLLHQRFEKGDVYPPSSSLRSDPLGTMVLYESLQALPGLEVTRDHSAVNRLPDGKNTTYLHLAGDSSEWDTMPVTTYRIIEQFLIDGGRLVVTFAPQRTNRFVDEETEKDETKQQEGDSKSSDPETAEKEDPTASPSPSPTRQRTATVSLKEKWNLDLDRMSQDPEREFSARNVSSLPLPAQIPWFGRLALKDPGPEWTVIYQMDTHPVLAVRHRGDGTLVVATDSYLLSNEAMAKNRQTDLLTWLIGPSTRVVFDEAHFGIVDSPGLASLARKYRLYGAAAVLALLAGLYLWKNFSPGRAPSDRASFDDPVDGRDATAGFVGLLRRNIPSNELLEVCLDEWKKSFARHPRITPQQIAAAEEIVAAEKLKPARERDPVATYHQLRAVLHHRAMTTQSPST